LLKITVHMLTNSHKERDSLLATYKEICICNPKSHTYCTGGSASDPNEGLSAPFVLFKKMVQTLNIAIALLCVILF